MKTSLTKLSSSFFLTILSFNLWARPVAQVIQVNGPAFVVRTDGKTSSLKLNEHIEEDSEILIEEGASVTLNDYFNATYHALGGSHFKFSKQSVQLKKGKAWIKSLSPRYSLTLTTANALVTFRKSEFIAIFDQAKSRSQVLVINGEVEASTILNTDLKYLIPSGTFSVIDPEIDNGLIRAPVKVGLQSLNQALAEFKQLPERIKMAHSPKRELASVLENEVVQSVPKGKIIFMTSTQRRPAAVDPGDGHKYYQQLVHKKGETHSVQVRVYGLHLKENVDIKETKNMISKKIIKTDIVEKKFFTKERIPASVPMISTPAAKKEALTGVIDPEFEQSLKKHQVEQPKHKKELQNLLDDLKSF
jgi:hypothetical protein